MEAKAARAVLGLEGTPRTSSSRPGRGARGPGRRGPPSAPPDSGFDPIEFKTAQDVTEAIASAQDKVYETLLSQACTKCHGQLPSARNQAPEGDWAAIDWGKVEPGIPDQWLTRSLFSHDAHAFLSCLECHGAASPRAQEDASADRDSDDPEALAPGWTGRTKDIMLPGIETCRSCHSPQGGARHDCALCHVYHGRAR